MDRTEDIDAAMDALVNERFRLEHRMMLRGTVFHEGKPVFQDIALNEIIATSAEHLRVLRYDLAVNDEYLNEYAADGVMVATLPVLLPIIFPQEGRLWLLQAG